MDLLNLFARGILRPFETAFVCKIAAEEAETMEVSQLVELKAIL